MVAALVWLGVTLFPVAKRAVWIYQEIREYNAWAEQFQKERGVDPLPVTLRHKGTPAACYDLTHGGVRYCLPQQRLKEIDLVDNRHGKTVLFVSVKSRIADPQVYGKGVIRITKDVPPQQESTLTRPEKSLVIRFNRNNGTEDWDNPAPIRQLVTDPARQDKWTQLDTVFCRRHYENCFALIKNQRAHAVADIEDSTNLKVPLPSAYRLSGDLEYQEPGSNAFYTLPYGDNTGTEVDLAATMMALLEEFRAIERAAILD
ncbi:hypothetical protein AY555_10865 (plasmid) [Haematospirillum jordaniae]|uniref:Uncharacterized protein n=2 Tax=Haematospirillum jordaniae TaxID=1549855 RepID=A0A143DGG9_9PROT|nr:hypothetical protein AY555_10865 [Haematospirillum jordaniae]